MFLTPATIIVLFVIGTLVLLSAIIGRPNSCGAPAEPRQCGCGHLNPAEAKYCGHCGKRI